MHEYLTMKSINKRLILYGFSQKIYVLIAAVKFCCSCSIYFGRLKPNRRLTQGGPMGTKCFESGVRDLVIETQEPQKHIYLIIFRKPCKSI